MFQLIECSSYNEITDHTSVNWASLVIYLVIRVVPVLILLLELMLKNTLNEFLDTGELAVTLAIANDKVYSCNTYELDT